MKDTILITGEGQVADYTVARLQAQGLTVVRARAGISQGSQSAGWPFASRPVITHCRGTAGNFEVTLSGADGVQTLVAAAIVAADDVVRQSNMEAWHLEPGQHVLGLQDFSTQAANDGCDRQIAFLSDVVTNSQTPVTADMLTAALAARMAGAHTVFFTGNLKVADHGLEAQYYQARQAGVVFVRLTHTRPAFSPAADGAWQIEYFDQITGMTCQLTPNLVVVDETRMPSAQLADLARILRLSTDAAGFLQSDNVHRLPVATLRRGILAVGGARAVMSDAAALQDADNAVLAVLRLLAAPAAETDRAAQINHTPCVKCLTCYRVCPYRAVVLNTRPEIMAGVCETCGICAAECPGKAIHINTLSPADIAGKIRSFQWPQPPEAAPRLVAFACQRSAMAAYTQACEQNLTLPAGLLMIPLPCAGAVSHEHILGAFENHADGVCILTCHAGNCHAEEGNLSAWRRAAMMGDMLELVGIGAARLRVHPLAANMPVELAAALMAFATELTQQRRLSL